MTGIGGVLESLISDNTPTPRPTKTTLDRPGKRSHARSGRPPGNVSAKARPRETLTVRIDVELVEKYRDWSWDARCNLGELVGRAMQIYLKNRRRDG